MHGSIQSNGGLDFPFGRITHSFQGNSKPFAHESKRSGRHRAKNTSCKMHGTCCSALARLKGDLFYHLALVFPEKGLYDSNFFPPFTQWSNHDHLNHSYSRTLEKKSKSHVGIFGRVCVCVYVRKGSINWSIY